MTYSKTPSKCELIKIIKRHPDLNANEMAILFGWKTRTQYMKLCASHGIKHGDFEKTYIMSGKNKVLNADIISAHTKHHGDISKIVVDLDMTRSNVIRHLRRLGLSVNTKFKLVNYDKEIESYLGGTTFIGNVNDQHHFLEYFKRQVNKGLINWPENLYTIEYCREILASINISGRGFIKKIEEDPILYKSILSHIDDNDVGLDRKGNKNFLERVFLVLNPEEIGNNICKIHNKPVKFYNLNDGYMVKGCESCHKRGYSQISQDLFWSVFDRLPQSMQSNVRFASLNKELRIEISPNHKREYDTKTRYFLDFKVNDFNIEFDGDWWHKQSKSDDVKRDAYLINARGYNVLRIKECDYRANQEKVINECLMFLTQGGLK